LGFSLCAGGLKWGVQVFSKDAAGSASTMSVLSAIALLVPAIFVGVTRNTDPSLKLEHKLSLGVSIVLVVTYMLTLIFQLYTNKSLFDEMTPEEKAKALQERHAERDKEEKKKEEEEEEHEEHWSMKKAAVVLVCATGVVAGLSEVLTDAVSEAGEKLGLGEIFMGVVIVAIVGNAAEHSTAVMMARKDKVDVAINIAFGSALQISLFVVPILVICSYGRKDAHGNSDPMDLLFSEFEVFCVASAVVIAWMVVTDGSSNWLEGTMLIMLYFCFAIGFFFLPEGEGLSEAAPSICEAVAACPFNATASLPTDYVCSNLPSCSFNFINVTKLPH